MQLLDQKTAREIQELPGYFEYEEGLRKLLGTINSLNMNSGSDDLKNPDAKKPTFQQLSDVYHSTDDFGQETMMHQLDLIDAVKTINFINKCAAGKTQVNYVWDEKRVPLAEFLKDAKENKIFLDKDSFLHNLNDGDEAMKVSKLRYPVIYKNLSDPRALMDKNGLDTTFIDNLVEFAKQKRLNLDNTPVPLNNLSLIVKIPSFEAAYSYTKKRKDQSNAEFTEHHALTESDSTEKSYALGAKLNGAFDEMADALHLAKLCTNDVDIYKKVLGNGLFLSQSKASYLVDYMKSLKDELPGPFNKFIDRMAEAVNRGASPFK